MTDEAWQIVMLSVGVGMFLVAVWLGVGGPAGLREAWAHLKGWWK